MAIRTRRRRRRRDHPRPTSVAIRGLIICGIAALIGFGLLRLYNGVPGENYATYYVSTPQVGNLLIHDPVRIAGSRVGQVRSIGIGERCFASPAEESKRYSQFWPGLPLVRRQRSNSMSARCSKQSVHRHCTRVRASSAPRFAVTVVLPTPPLKLMTDTTFIVPPRPPEPSFDGLGSTQGVCRA